MYMGSITSLVIHAEGLFINSRDLPKSAVSVHVAYKKTLTPISVIGTVSHQRLDAYAPMRG